MFDVEAGRIPQQPVERWCNVVAADLLAPIDAVRATLKGVALFDRKRCTTKYKRADSGYVSA